MCFANVGATWILRFELVRAPCVSRCIILECDDFLRSIVNFQFFKAVLMENVLMT